MELIERVKAEKMEKGVFDFLDPVGDSANDTIPGLATVVSNVIDIILFVAAALAIIYLIYSGILYITAAGNPDAAKKGQQGIINAVIGIVIIVLAYIIARAVASYATGVGTGT